MCDYWGVSEREAKKLEKLVEKRHWNSMLSKLEQPEEIIYNKVYIDHQENEFTLGKDTVPSIKENSIHAKTDG